MIRTPDQLRAGHRPSDEIPPGTPPANVTIVHVYPSPWGEVLVTLTATIGVCTTAWILAGALESVAQILVTASPALCGVSIALRRAKP